MWLAASDIELLDAWRSGDARAGNALFERYFERLFRFFATKTERGVDDLIQETLLACLSARDGLRDDAAFRTFVFGVARRRLYRRWRDQHRGANAIDFGLTSVTDLGPSPSSVVAQRQAHRRLVAALQRLPVELQIALELFYWEGMRASDIGEVIELPEGTVRSRLRRARSLLRDEMEKQLGSSELADADVDALAKSLGATPLPEEITDRSR